ncbi:MAG: hypothetical protein K6T85_04170, partial [Gorillibacterium sp.]|nr:hypothetical protein [Gorillibacterium sp.]
LGHPLFADKMYGPGGELETGEIPGVIREEADGSEWDEAKSTTGSPMLEGLERTLPYPIRRQALHAAKLGFIHPGTGCPVEFIAPLPTDMRETVEMLRKQDEETHEHNFAKGPIML